MLRRTLLLVLACLTLTGCQTGALPPTATSSNTSSGPSASASPSATPSVSTPTASSPAPSVPPAQGARDVSRFDHADFASPSGRIWCGLHADHALCHFPMGGFQGTIPQTADVCPDAGLDVTGVEVSSVGSDYFCSGDPSAWPVRGSTQVQWRAGTGFPYVTYDGQRLATLPYGRSLRHGNYACRSETNGVTCVNVRTGRGFRMARAGVVLF